MRPLLTISALAGLLCLHQPATAKSDDDVRMILAGQPITIAPDKGYALIRSQSRYKLLDVVVMRVPSSEEMAKYETAKQAAYAKAGNKAGPYDQFHFTYKAAPNLWNLPLKRELMELPNGRMILGELPPGEYVLYGLGYSNILSECFCLGTVRFSLKPGIVTDLGTVLLDDAWAPSSIPELASVTGQGIAAKIDYGVFAGGLRPANGSEAALPGVDVSKIKRAHFVAQGPFIETSTMLITHLAPVEGVLKYDQGRVIDAVTGKELYINE